MKSILGSSSKDWIFLILSSISGFLLVGFYFALKSFTSDFTALILTLLIFSILFDVRHLFITYTRTLFDKAFMKENRHWFTMSWILILLLPIVFLFALSWGDYITYRSSIVMAYCSRLVFVFGFYHLIKQNWGFMAIYKNKAGEDGSKTDRNEKLMLISGSFLSFIWIAWQQPIWFPGEELAFSPKAEELQFVLGAWSRIAQGTFITALIFLGARFSLNSQPQFKGIITNIALFFLTAFLMIRLVLQFGATPVLKTIFIFALIFFVTSTILVIREAIKSRSFNTGKWGILISSLILYNGILLLPIDEKLVVVMAVTIPHNIQYLVFVRHFNSKSFSTHPEKHGLAATMTRKLGFFMAISIGYAVLFEGIRTGIRFSPVFLQSEFLYMFRNTVVVLFFGMVLHHYFLDAVIWRVRKDKELSKNI